jgi:hypothetical protein
LASLARRIFDGVTAIFGSRVTRVARVVTIPESVNGFTVGGGGSSDRHFSDVHLPGLVPNSNVTIFFRVRPLNEDATFQVRLNKTIAARFTYDEPSNTPSYWHKLLPPRALESERNELVFSASGPTAPGVEFSDVLLLYQSDDTTVKTAEPVVLDG